MSKPLAACSPVSGASRAMMIGRGAAEAPGATVMTAKELAMTTPMELRAMA